MCCDALLPLLSPDVAVNWNVSKVQRALEEVPPLSDCTSAVTALLQGALPQLLAAAVPMCSSPPSGWKFVCTGRQSCTLLTAYLIASLPARHHAACLWK